MTLPKLKDGPTFSIFNMMVRGHSPSRGNKAPTKPAKQRALALVLILGGLLFLKIVHVQLGILTKLDPGMSSLSPISLLMESTGWMDIQRLRLSSTPPKGGFLHMGKTGGSTLSLLLTNGCHSFVKKPCREVQNETIASKMVETYYHIPDFGALPDKNHSFYIITTRDPLDRFISAFAYDHPANDESQGKNWRTIHRFGKGAAYKCFPSLEKFVELVGTDPDNYYYPYKPSMLVQKNCTNFARAIMHGKVRRLNHLYFGYEKIQSFLPKNNATIYATRIDHLLDDWKSINYILGQKEEVFVSEGFHARDQSGLKLPITRDLGPKGRRTLCRALQREYDSYFWFLSNAVNLNEKDLEVSLQYSKRNCPHVDFSAVKKSAG